MKKIDRNFLNCENNFVDEFLMKNFKIYWPNFNPQIEVTIKTHAYMWGKKKTINFKWATFLQNKEDK